MKTKVYFATEENGYEMSVEEFDTLEEAQNYADGIDTDLENDDECYDFILEVCQTDEECKSVEEDITKHRKDFAAITLFGDVYDCLSKKKQKQVDNEI